MPDPSKKDKSKDAAADASGAGTPPKKSKGMLIGLIVGGVLLLTCCCTGIGGGGLGWWYFKSAGGNSAIVGKWRNNFLEYEFRSDGKMKLNNFTTGIKLDLVYQSVGPDTIEIKGDTVGNNKLNGQPYPTRRLEVRVTGNELHVRALSPEMEKEGFTLKKSG